MIDGALPRLEEKVACVIDRLSGRKETERECVEKAQVHEREIGTLFEQVGGKAGAAPRRTASSTAGSGWP